MSSSHNFTILTLERPKIINRKMCTQFLTWLPISLILSGKRPMCVVPTLGILPPLPACTSPYCVYCDVRGRSPCLQDVGHCLDIEQGVPVHTGGLHYYILPFL